MARSITAWTAAALLAAAPSGSGAVAKDAAAGARPRLAELVYDYAVTSYCGLLTGAVERGFRLQLARVTAREGLDPEAARRQRVAGWARADREWHNRGLGGFRGWCRTEGLAAAARFDAVAGAPGD